MLRAVRNPFGRGIVALAGFAMVLAALGACRFQSQAPRDQKKAWQRTQAKGLAPAKLEADNTGAWSRVVPVRVRAYAGPAFTERHPDWQAHLEAQFERANEVLKADLAMRLELEAAREWPHRGALGDMEGLLTELANHDAGDDVRFVIGFVGTDSSTIASFHELGLSRFPGKHFLVREMDDVNERRALTAGLDALGVEEREKLYQSRKRHKEVVVLLHELGHALGAIHARQANWIMHPKYHHDMQAFSPQNRQIMQVVAASNLGGPQADGATVSQVFESIIELLDGAGARTWLDEEREQRRAALSDALKVPAQGAGAPAPALPAAASSAPVVGAPSQTPQTSAIASTPLADLSALSDDHRAHYHALASRLGNGPAQDHLQEVQALADRYPDVYLPQELLCKAGMAARVGITQVRALCKRMGELAAGSPR